MSDAEPNPMETPNADPVMDDNGLSRRILIIEDDALIRQPVAQFLRSKGYEILEADNGPEGLEKATSEKPDMILLDLRLPGMDGLAVTRELRRRAGTMMIPINVITGLNDRQTRIDVFRAGGDGLLMKPFDLEELLARVERAVEVSRGFTRLTHIDALTEIYNRRYFNGRIEVEFSRARRHRHALALAMIDIDFFKHFNDSYGHQAGDFVLRAVAQFIKKSLRIQDIVCRYGGEEFAVIMPVTAKADAVLVLDRIRAQIDQQRFRMDGVAEPFEIRISAGIAAFPSDADNEMALIHCSDTALYEAKKTGRNKVHAYAGCADSVENKILKE